MIMSRDEGRMQGKVIGKQKGIKSRIISLRIMKAHKKVKSTENEHYNDISK